jgi:hypothetical protein
MQRGNEKPYFEERWTRQLSIEKGHNEKQW